MSAPRRGLGQGLGALLGEERSAPALRAIPVAQIRPNPQQPRSTFDPASLEELRASIAEFGVLVPVIVRRIDDGYELIAGERRWRAATAAQLETIPAIVRDVDARESLEVAIVENLQRQDLDPLEEAMGFAHLIETYQLTQEQVAERVGKSRPAVANAMRLLSLPASIKVALRSGAISPGHARALLAIPEAERELVARRIVSRGMTVRAVEALANREKKPRRAPAGLASSADLEAAASDLRYKYGAHVSIVPRGTGGTIEIRYADSSELIRIVDLLLQGSPAST